MNLYIKKITSWFIGCIFLVGLTFVWNGNVLCIGEDGHIEIETNCIPCCSDTDKACKEELCITDESENHHEEHNDCNNCFDLELDGTTWLKRFQITNFNYNFKLTSLSIIDSASYYVKTYLDYSNIYKNKSLFGQNPPNVSITTTVVRC
jgi:hypothetical protein